MGTWIVGAAFVGILLLVLIPYWLLVVRDEQRVLARLQPRKGGRAKKLNVLKPEDSMSSVGPLDSMLKSSGFGDGIQAFLDSALHQGVLVQAKG